MAGHFHCALKLLRSLTSDLRCHLTPDQKQSLAVKRNRLLQYVLIFVGLFSCIGYIFDMQPIRGLGFATVASPLPLVFSHFRGHEAFANELSLKMVTKSGRIHEDRIDYRIFSGMDGPYNRRNAYGAVISFGPFFTSEKELQLRDSILQYGFCHPAPLVKTYGIDEALSSAEIYVRPRIGGSEQSWTIPVNCPG